MEESIKDITSTASKSVAVQPSSSSTLVASEVIEKTSQLGYIWEKKIASAKSKWDRLSDSELLGTEGDPSKLTSLVQARYLNTFDQASKQVKSFIEKCKS